MSPLVKRLSWALAASLALNLFGLGYLVARALRHPPPPAHHAHPPGAPEVKLFGRRMPELRAHHRKVRDARREVADALVAEPFDDRALATALAHLREATGAGQVELHEALLERAREMRPEDRRALAHGRFLRRLAPGP